MRTNLSSPVLRSSSFFLLALLLLSACSENVSDSVGNNHQITFSAVVDDGWDSGTRSADKDVFQEMEPVRFLSGQAESVSTTNGNHVTPLYLHATVEPFTSEITSTRGTLINSIDNVNAFGVSGYVYGNGKTLNDVSANFYHNAKVTKTAGLWQSSEPYYIPSSSDTLAFKAYAPYGDSNTVVDPNTDNGTLKLTYTVNNTVTSQTDLMVANVSGEFFSVAPTYHVPLTFKHALTAVRLEVGDDIAPGYIKSVSFKNIRTSGTLSVGKGWTYGTLGNFTVNYSGSGFNTMGDNTVMSGGANTLLMIPQTFDDDDPGIQVVLNNGTTHTIAVALRSAGTSWQAGTIVTYRINTSSLNVLGVNSVTYPTTWGTQSFSSVKSSYDDGASIGMYAVNNVTGLVTEANVKYTYDQTNNVWKTDDGVIQKYKKNHSYYAYYPYNLNISGGHQVGDDVSTVTTAKEFFSGTISNWTVSTGIQNTKDLLLANDLQICKGTVVSGGYGKYNFPMAHAMGLVVLNLQTKSVPTTRYSNIGSDGSVSSYTNEGTTSITASSDFNLSNKMLAVVGTNRYFYVVKSGTTLTASSTDTGSGKWASEVSMSATEGNSSSYTATCARTYLYPGWNYSYQGKVQTLTLPVTGTYTLKCYGAQGGRGHTDNRGGYGGYAYGNIQLNAGNVLYICVGGKGGDGTTKNGGDTSLGGSGGYNGGGSGGGSKYLQQGLSVYGGGGGGGATHIATKLEGTGLLSAYKNYQSEVLLVAGGGGGGSRQVDGGYGGGTSGETKSNTNASASGGGQTSGYAFGSGMSCTGVKLNNKAAGANGGQGNGGGGGGWYGGNASNDVGSNTNCGGGGGSGHIGSGFVSGTTGMSNGSRTGNGYVQIKSNTID